jgi:hypothetical protein
MDTIGVLINDCHGGWGMSRRAIQMFNERTGQNLKSFEFLELARHDPILVQIYRELGSRFSGDYAEIKLETIDKKYENHYSIVEYDGMEHVKIDFDRYKLDTIQSILQNGTSSDDQITELKKLF